jgi:hypothetical protein
MWAGRAAADATYRRGSTSNREGHYWIRGNCRSGADCAANRRERRAIRQRDQVSGGGAAELCAERNRSNAGLSEH